VQTTFTLFGLEKCVELDMVLWRGDTILDSKDITRCTELLWFRECPKNIPFGS